MFVLSGVSGEAATRCRTVSLLSDAGEVGWGSRRGRRDLTAAGTLRGFRQAFYGCLRRWGDALFEFSDAVLCAATPVASVPALSLEPAFRRSHGSLYKALARGDIDTERLRDTLVAHRPTD